MCLEYPFFSPNPVENLHTLNRAGVIQFEHPIFNAISGEALQLLRKMLKFNLEERISVDEALEMTWFDNVVYQQFPVSDDLSPYPGSSPRVPRRVRNIQLPSYGAFLPSISPAASPGASPDLP